MPNIVYNTTATAAPLSSVAFTDAGEIFTAGNITSGNTAIAPTVVAGTVNAATIGNSGATLTGTVSTASQPNITTLAGATSIGASGVTTSVVGNLSITGSGGNVTGVNTLFATTINAATIGNSGATLTGTVSTASQPNITTLAGVTSIGAAGVITAIVGNLTVGGYLTVSVNSVSIAASTLSIVDPIISLNTPADLSPLTTTTTADIGLKFHYYSGSDRHAFLGRAQDTGYLEWYSDGNDTANVFTGTAYGGIKAGALFLANTGTVLTTSGTIVAATVNAATIGNASAVLYGTLNSSSATQNNITTMTGLTGFGSSGVTTTAAGNFTVSGTFTGSAPAGSLTGSTLASGVTASSLTSVGSLGSTQISSLGVGTAASGTGGEIRATNNITAYYSSDAQFKENVQDVPDALSIVTAIGSKLFDWTDAYIADHGGEDGYFVQKSDFGVIAQDVQRVFPQAVRTRPDGSLAVDYEKLATLSFGAIGQLLARIEALEAR